MPNTEQLPEKCQKCAKRGKLVVHKGCDFCRDLAFQEDILCYLNRSVQDPDNFDCHAFQPKLALAGTHSPEPSSAKAPSEVQMQRALPPNYLNSDKMKYKKALALQKLGRDPDDVFASLRYHFAWNVFRRKAVFSAGSSVFDIVNDAVFGCSVMVGGFAGVLWLAPDHMHVYADTDGELSVDSIVKRIKGFTEKAIFREFKGIPETLGMNRQLWDEAYFAETVG